MSFLGKELSSSDIVGGKDASGADNILPEDTLILELNGIPKEFDAYDLDGYLEKVLGKVIRRTGVANGVTMNDKVAVIGVNSLTDKENIKVTLESMFSKPLKDVREDIGRVSKLEKEVS